MHSFLVKTSHSTDGFFDGYCEGNIDGFVVFLDGKAEGWFEEVLLGRNDGKAEGWLEEMLLGASDGNHEKESVDTVTNTLSTFGPPFEPVAVTRTVLLPGLQTADTTSGCQSSQPLVITNGTLPASLPFIVTSLGRDCHLPLAYRNWKVHGPPEDPTSIFDSSKKEPSPPMSTYPVPV